MTSTLVEEITGQNRPIVTVRHLAIFFVLIGLVITGYLSYGKLSATELICLEGELFDCSAIQNSKWASLLGIPIAYLGFIGYAVLGILLLIEDLTTFLQENCRLIVFAFTLLAWAYSMVLVYIQAFVMQTFCPWCLGHEAVITVLFGLAIYRLWQDLAKP